MVIRKINEDILVVEYFDAVKLKWKLKICEHANFRDTVSFLFIVVIIIIVSFFFRRKGCGILIRFHKSKLVRNKFSIEKTDRVETLSSRKRRVAVPDAR